VGNWGTGLDGCTVRVEVSFTTAPLAAPSWVDITPFVRSVRTDAGRSSEFSKFSPRTCDVVLDNNDRRFDPLYADGPYIGTPLLSDEGESLLTDEGAFLRPDGDANVTRLLPMKRIRVTAT